MWLCALTAGPGISASDEVTADSSELGACRARRGNPAGKAESLGTLRPGQRFSTMPA